MRCHWCAGATFRSYMPEAQWRSKDCGWKHRCAISRFSVPGRSWAVRQPQHNAAGEDRTPDLRIMRPTRCELRHCRERRNIKICRSVARQHVVSMRWVWNRHLKRPTNRRTRHTTGPTGGKTTQQIKKHAAPKPQPSKRNQRNRNHAPKTIRESKSQAACLLGGISPVALSTHCCH